MGIIVALVPILVPFLVEEAEKMFPNQGAKTGDQKYEWVVAAVHEMLDALGKRVTIPNWAATVEPGIEKLLDDALEAAVAKIDP